MEVSEEFTEEQRRTAKALADRLLGKRKPKPSNGMDESLNEGICPSSY
jgi:hypothetical protein